VRLSASDLAHLRKAAAIAWPGAPTTKSSILLGLACLKADELIKRRNRAKKWGSLASYFCLAILLGLTT
jgi:hypothetical protein